MKDDKTKEIMYVGDVGKPNTALSIHAQNMARLFGKMGYHTTFICDAYKGMNKISDETELFNYCYTSKFITIPKISAIEWLIDELTGWKYRKILKEKIRSKKPEFVLMYGYAGESWMVKYCHKKKIPFIVERVDWFEKSDRTGFIERELFQRQVDKTILKIDKHVDGVISISKFFEEYYYKMNVPTIFVPPIFEFGNNDILKNYERSSMLHLVYAGSIGGNKDYIFPVLQAMKRINSKKIHVHMDLIGLTLGQVENLTGEACWQKYGVDILGRVPNSMAKRIIQRADFSFLLRENKQYAKAGFSTKFAESMCLGVPVICTKVGGADSVITHMYDGICLENNDISTIEKTLIFLMNKSSEEIMEMKSNAYITASRLFNIESYIEGMDGFLNKIKELYEYNKKTSKDNN